MFNSYFYSVFNDKDLINDSLTTTNETSGASLSDIVITAEDVHEALVSLDPNKAMGPDGISPKVLKYCADALCQPISYLFQLTITNSYLPSEWRTHCVIPIFKCGNRTTISNYHPISLLCIISKVLEKIIFNISIKFLSNSFTPHQFGFLPGRSTLQQLLLFINELLEAKRTNKVSDVIYLDFKKAFDSVTHTKLLHKIRSFGITGTLFNWFVAYLSNRVQYVRVNNSLSEFLPVLSGVSQGSILGPLFFVLFINDLLKCLKFSSAFIYADDTKCLKHRSGLNTTEMNLLQKDLDNLFQWGITSDLYYHFSKFAHLQFWLKSYMTAASYFIDNKLIATVDSTKDLGIIITQNLTWENHYKLISGKAYKILGLIRRSFSGSGPVETVYLTCSFTNLILFTSVETLSN